MLFAPVKRPCNFCALRETSTHNVRNRDVSKVLCSVVLYECRATSTHNTRNRRRNDVRRGNFFGRAVRVKPPYRWNSPWSREIRLSAICPLTAYSVSLDTLRLRQ